MQRQQLASQPREGAHPAHAPIVHFSRTVREFLWLKLLSVWLFVMAAIANGCKLILTNERTIKMKTLAKLDGPACAFVEIGPYFFQYCSNLESEDLGTGGPPAGD